MMKSSYNMMMIIGKQGAGIDSWSIDVFTTKRPNRRCSSYSAINCMCTKNVFNFENCVVCRRDQFEGLCALKK